MESSAFPSKNKTSAPYGSWKSPISADHVSGAAKRLSGISVDAKGRLFLVEVRPAESGRDVLVKVGDSNEVTEILPKEFAVRSVTNELGGGAFTILGDSVIFNNYKDQRLYKQDIESKDATPVPITPDYGGPAVSYADGIVDSRFDRYIAVMEDYRLSYQNATASIAAVPLSDDGGGIQEPKVLVSGNDFYGFPRLDPKGEKMAWIEWSHPNMPWDKSQLWVGYISESGDIYKSICVAGSDPTILESLTEPKWSPKGELFFITNRKTGYWNLHKWVESENEVIPVYSLDAEFSRPLWQFRINSYEFMECSQNRNLIACSYRQKGKSYLGIVDDAQNSISLLDIPFTDINNIVLWKHSVYIEGASAVHPLSVAKVNLDINALKVVDSKIIWSSSSPDTSKFAPYFSTPEFIEFPTEFPGQYAYAFYYHPSNPIYQASQEEKPPLLVESHGGPTEESRASLNLRIQYWTSRGWAFVDVNYGGSSGYGREYRDRLLGNWGIVDVNDCCSCARFLVESGKVDPDRLCIAGESAGGYTTLAALAFRDTFKAGASLYGISDLNLLEAESHKFESHYTGNMAGNEKVCFERSPINHVDKFSCPIILFQGLDDKVVPPVQARTIYKALKEKGLPVALVQYEGEQHGFRKAENLKFTLEQQMVFFARLVGHFNVADPITPIKIDNFD